MLQIFSHAGHYHPEPGEGLRSLAFGAFLVVALLVLVAIVAFANKRSEK